MAIGFFALYAHSYLEGRFFGDTLEAVGAARLVEGVQELGPAALLVVVGYGLRYAIWQGPVVFSGADVAFLLSAPIARSELVRPKLVRGLIGGAVVGFSLGLVVFLVLEGKLGVDTLPLLTACLAGPGALGLLTAALGWRIECLVALSRALLRYGPLVYPLACALALASVFGGQGFSNLLTLFSGPWAWATSPIVAAVGGSASYWPVAAALLACATTLAVADALAHAGKAPTEELSRRAAFRRSLFVALYLTDYREATLLGRSATRDLASVSPRRLPQPKWSLLAVPWRDVLWASRAPGRVMWSVVLFGGATFGALTAPASVVVVVTAILAAYLAAAQLVEPIRLEADTPAASRRLPYPYGDLVLLHSLVPTLVLAAVGALACALGFVAGLISVTSLLLSLIACPFVAANLTLCAAVAAQRSRTLPAELLVSSSAFGEIGGIPILLWYLRGPLLASLTLGVPTFVILFDVSEDLTTPLSMLGAAASLVLALVIETSWLRGRGAPE